MNFLDLDRDFVSNGDGVFVSRDAASSQAGQPSQIKYDYSDGDVAEKYVADAIANATDRSTQSAQLEGAIRDWSSRYHLSSVRGNLLRILNLSADSRVLEIGCGCGAITRFLGENCGHVDAIEGSLRRATIAANRCQDLSHVRVFNADANRLADPEHASGDLEKYDLVTFIGVLEYAGAYVGGDKTPEQAVQSLLAMAKGYLRKGGVVAIAIENRTGLKYLHGAGEDHYSKPWLGLYNYQADADTVNAIRTYTQSEWQVLLRNSGLQPAEFCLAFPDYKLPRLVVSEDYVNRVNSNPVETNTLIGLVEQTASEDHGNGDLVMHDEPMTWRGVAQAGQLTQFANSFLIVASADESALDGAIAQDFTFGPTTNRRHCYRTVTRKPRRSFKVEKLPVAPDALTPEGPMLFEPSEAQYLVGETLAQRWRRHLQTRDGYHGLLKDVESYSSWLTEQFNGSSDTSAYIDLLPANIMIVEGKGEGASPTDTTELRYQTFDHEWRCQENISADFVMFRGLLYFLSMERDLVSQLALPDGVNRVVDLIEGLFTHCQRTLYDHLIDFIALETQIQKQTQHRYRRNDIDTLLQGSFAQIQGQARLYWSLAGEDTTLENSVDINVVAGEERQNLVFDLPEGIRTVDYLRFDPGEKPGYFRIYSVELFGLDLSGSPVSLFRCGSGRAVFDAVDCVDIRYGRELEKDVFLALSQTPFMVFHMDRLKVNQLPADMGGGLSLHVQMSWTHTDEFKILREDYIRRNEQLLSEKEAVVKENKVLLLERKELQIIKASRVWRLAEKSRVLFYKRFLSRLPWLQAMMLNVSRRGARAVGGELLKGQFKLATSAPLEPVTGRIAPAKRRSTEYEQYVVINEQLRPSDADVLATISRLEKTPLISIVMPVYNVEAQWLTAAIDSIEAQRYENWELCLVDDCSTLAETREELNWISHPKINLQRLTVNQNISAATNAGLQVAKGDYIAFMDHDDLLDKDALLHVVVAINEHDPEFIYSDEDFIDTQDVRQNPVFKPDFSPELLLSHNYITHFCVIKRSLLDDVGGLRSEYDGAQDYDFVLRATELAKSVHHIPKILYHWRMIEQSTSANVDAKPEAIERTRLVLQEALSRRQVVGSIDNANLPFFFRTRYALASPAPLVSIIVPFKDKPELLQSCIGKTAAFSRYKSLEIIGISNNSERDDTFRAMRSLEEQDSRIRFIEVNEEFNFSSLVNHGVRAAQGQHVVLLNNDVEIISWDWIEAMLEHSQRREIGVVGGQLLFPNNFVQHAGIVVGIGGYAGHPHKYMACKQPGYVNRISIVQNMSAVTGAFMMVEKAIYEEVGGFDEHNFKVACNDVDFCLRVAETGRRNVYTPYARAYHLESVSRGYEDSDAKQARFDAEKALFVERHARILADGDPYYNVNLALDTEHFGVKVPQISNAPGGA